MRLAPRGEQALAAARSFHRAYERRLAREVGADQVAALRSVLTAMAGSDGLDERVPYV